MNLPHRKQGPLLQLSADPSAPTAVFVLTSERVDRDNEIVNPAGGDFSDFAVNPGVLALHRTGEGFPLATLAGEPPPGHAPVENGLAIWQDWIGDGTAYLDGPRRHCHPANSRGWVPPTPLSALLRSWKICGSRVPIMYRSPWPGGVISGGWPGAGGSIRVDERCGTWLSPPGVGNTIRSREPWPLTPPVARSVCRGASGKGVGSRKDGLSLRLPTPFPFPATLGGHPADRVGAPGGRRGTIRRVRGVD